MMAENQVTHAQGGTKGRLLRVCMGKVRQDPRWQAKGQMEQIMTPYGQEWRQRLVRPASKPE